MWLQIDEYRDDNGGTKYLPGSWALGRKPPSSDAVEFDPSDAACIEAPAGSVSSPRLRYP